MSKSAYDIAVDRINNWIKNDNIYLYLSLNDLGLTNDDFNRLEFPSKVTCLDCSFNRLTKMDLNIPDLETLHCCGNNLIEINIKAEHLIDLYCWNNNLIKIELSTNKHVVYLGCYGNKYLYLSKKQRKIFRKERMHDINYNEKATIIQKKYGKYKARKLYKYLNQICFMYNDINQIISLY